MGQEENVKQDDKVLQKLKKMFVQVAKLHRFTHLTDVAVLDVVHCDISESILS